MRSKSEIKIDDTKDTLHSEFLETIPPGIKLKKKKRKKKGKSVTDILKGL